jgi:hypothetical protein
VNAKQTYLAWVRTMHPQVYYQALAQVFHRNGNLGGLGDDLTDSISAFTPDLSDTGSIDTSVSSDVSDAINNAYSATQSPDSSTQGGSTDWFGSLASAISNISSTALQTQAAQNLLKINTTRAQQGLPPLTANGIPVTGAMLSPTSATVAQMEAALAGSGGVLLPLLIGGGLLLAYAMSRR